VIQGGGGSSSEAGVAKGDGSMSAQRINRDWRGRRGCKVSTGKCTKGTQRRKSGKEAREGCGGPGKRAGKAMGRKEGHCIGGEGPNRMTRCIK